MEESHRGQAERVERILDARLSHHLELAIQAIELAWALLCESTCDVDIDTEKPDQETATRLGYFEAMKWGALELSDGIYWASSEATRHSDDNDLQEFETTGTVSDHCSARIRALALVTYAKALVEMAFGKTPTGPWAP